MIIHCAAWNLVTGVHCDAEINTNDLPVDAVETSPDGIRVECPVCHQHTWIRTMPP